MTVAELVEALKALPQDAEVVVARENDYAVALHVGRYTAWQRSRPLSQYSGNVRLRAEWEEGSDLQELLDDRSIAPRPDVVLITAEEDPGVVTAPGTTPPTT